MNDSLTENSINLESKISKEYLKTRFRNLAREYFQDHPKYDFDYFHYLRESSRLNSAQLPVEYAELFIPYEKPQLFLSCDTKALYAIEEALGFAGKNKNKKAFDYQAAKEYFNKWTIQKSEQEKKFYSSSFIKNFEKEGTEHNVLHLIMYAVILLNDRKYFNPDEALRILFDAKEKAVNLNLEPLAAQNLHYLLNLFTGFALLRQDNYYEALNSFNEAIGAKSFGITAKFYAAYAEKKTGNFESCLNLVKDVFDYDLMRLRYSIQRGSLALHSYFLQNAIFYNVLTEMEFAELHEEIAGIIVENLSEKRDILENAYEIIEKINALEFQEYYNDQINKGFEFLSKYYQNYRGAKNALARLSHNYLKEYLAEIAEMILESMREKHKSEIGNRLNIFDTWIQENQVAIDKFDKDLNSSKQKYKEAYDDLLKEIETKMNEAINETQMKSDNLPINDRYNPKAAFTNSIVYGVIISLMVFIFGGFSGCYSSSITASSSFGQIFNVVIMTGLKWGGLTFLVALIFALISAGFTAMERSNEKYRLASKLNYLKKKRERDLSNLQKQYDAKIKNIEEYYKGKIKYHEEKRNLSESEKTENLRLIEEEIEKKIEGQAKTLYSVINSL